PFFNKDIQIVNDGPGDEPVTVRRSSVAGTPRFGIFAINPGHTVLIAGLTIGNGFNQSSEGGGVSNNRSTVTVRNCTISGNQGFSGGGISNNTMFGSGTATLTLINCTFSGNTPRQHGGALEITTN